MDLINEIIARAKADRQRIVLPEGTEERTLKAADQVLADGVADIILIGNPKKLMVWLLNGVLRTLTKQQLLILQIIQRKSNTQNCFANFVRRKE